MSCTNTPVLAGLDDAPIETLRALLAALTLDHHCRGTQPELFDALEPVVRGEPPDAAAIDRGFGQIFRDVDYTAFYDDGFNAYYAQMQYRREVFAKGDRDELLAACRRAAISHAETLAHRAFHDGAHAAHYYYDSAALRDEVERNARDIVEARWAELY